MRAEDEAAWTAMVAPWKSAMPSQIYHPHGCLECRRTGYLGRMGLYEMLTVSAGVRKLIQGQTDLVLLREQAAKEGMKPLRISGARKVAAGLTTIEEVMKIASPSQ